MWWPERLTETQDLIERPSVEELVAHQQALEARLNELNAKAAAVREATQNARATVRSANGAVSLTVGMGGGLESISFLPKSAGMSPAMLSTTVMTAYRQACTQAAKAGVDGVAEIVGTHSPLMGMLRDVVPTFDEELS